MPNLRSFAPADTTACLDLFDGNTPRFFAVHERMDFSRYLLDSKRQHDYLVVERQGRIVACGGLALDDAHTAAFCWGMVERSQHRQGVGRALALERLARARALGVRRVVLSTSQQTCGFYAALGFALTRVVADGHGPGLDAMEMECTLPVARNAAPGATRSPASSTPAR